MMKSFSLGVLIFFVAIIIAGCSNDDFSGRTFNIIGSSHLLETKGPGLFSEDNQKEILSLTFDSGEVTINSDRDLKGEYQANDDELEITLDDGQGGLNLVFSDLTSSVEKDIKYTAEISTIDYTLNDTDILNQLEFLAAHDQEDTLVSFEETME